MQGDGEDVWGSIQRSSSYAPRISPGTLGDIPATRSFFWHSSQAKLKPGYPISHFVRNLGFAVFWELCLVHARLHHYLPTWIQPRQGIAKSFKLKPCRTNYARFDATNLEPAPTLKTRPVCVCVPICKITHIAKCPHVQTYHLNVHPG